MSPSAVALAATHINAGTAFAYIAATTMAAHNAATCALVELRLVAEKYYEAAGFRE